MGPNLPCRDCGLSAGGAVSFIPEEADNETPSSHSRSPGGGGENRNSPAAATPPRRRSCLSFRGERERKNSHQKKKWMFLEFPSSLVDILNQRQLTQ